MARCRQYWKKLFILAILSEWISVEIKAQDYPPASANLQTAPVGTIVIAMDNINQACSAPTAGTYLFNLKAYGLAIFLQDLDYNLQWVIASGKAHNGVDFTATAEKISPTYLAAQSYEFKAGPFLILPQDTADVISAIEWFNSYQYDSSKVKVYRLTSSVSVDVQYSLTTRVRAALLDLCNIHRNYMEMASVPTMNYECLPDASAINSGCYTIVTEPHVNPSGLGMWQHDSIYNFVLAGGNFLAQCRGIEAFENIKLYHSMTGSITAGSDGTMNNVSNIFYDNPNMAYSQFHGTFKPITRGQLKVWLYNSSNTNNWYPVVRTKMNGASSPWHYAAAVSKLTVDSGGVVFYLGNHEYVTHNCETCPGWGAINEQEINGIRLYLNAILVPANVPDCIFNIPLAVRLNDFAAYRKNNDAVQLRWSSVTEDEKTIYFIEHSSTGVNFKMIGQVMGKGNINAGDEYAFLHTNPAAGINYYRLKIISQSGKLTFSEIRRVAFDSNDQTLILYPNPATGKTILLLDVKDGERLKVRLYDASGRQVKKAILIVRNQKAELNIDGLHNGIYWIVASTSNGKLFTNKLQVF